MASNLIDLSDQRSFDKLFHYLENYFPYSFYLWQLLKRIEKNIISQQHLYPCQLHVNDPDDIQCILMIYSTTGFTPGYYTLLKDDHYPEIYITYFCHEETDHLLLSLIEQYVPWTKTKKICSFANDHRYSSILGDFLAKKNIGRPIFNSHYMMELDKGLIEELFQKYAALPLESSAFESEIIHACIDALDITIRPLSSADAVTVNDSWAYRSSISLSRITYEVEHFPAYGAYRDEKLISWCLTKYDGTIGNVNTLPEERRLGLSIRLIAHLVSKRERHESIFCFVSSENTASLKMFEKLGFRRRCDIDWIHFHIDSTE